jgi:hypothetical protein
MAHFGKLMFGPNAKALQEQVGSRRAYARTDGATAAEALGDDERAFVLTVEAFDWNCPPAHHPAFHARRMARGGERGATAALSTIGLSWHGERITASAP